MWPDLALRRSPGKDVQELHDYAVSLVEHINAKYGGPSYQPVVWLERSVPLYEKIGAHAGLLNKLYTMCLIC